MNKLNTESWQTYKIKELFNIETGKDLIYSELTPGEYCVIGHGRTDLGLTAKTIYLTSHKLYNNQETITLADRGNFYAACHNSPFYIGTRVKALTYKYPTTLNCLNFICTIINQEQFRHCYGRNSTDKLPDLEIKLPTKNRQPDNVFMNDFILNLGYKTIKSENKNSKSIDTTEWKEFKLNKLFAANRGQRLTQIDRELGGYPFVTAGFENYGVSEYIGNSEQQIFFNALTIDMFGNSYYYEKEFKCDDNILVLTSPNLNKYIAMFISTILTKDKYKNSYGRQYRQKDYNNHIIKLPAKENQPDWEFMENYIKSLPFADRI